MEHETFECFWEEVLDYAKELGVSPSYIEDEFILEGELHRVDIEFKLPENMNE